ncbi:MAG: LysM domain-containing protein [Chloroflexota bacterium]
MTERSALEAGAVACPFVAFVDDREARADVPDHRHRCYAEIRPAPRALAHQQAFCLSSGFAACPTFQDWARREAARAATPGQRPAARSAAASVSGLIDESPVAANEARADLEVDPYDADARRDQDQRLVPSEEPGGDDVDDDRFDDRASRNPHRDWAAPPPWVDPGDAPDGPDPDAPGFLASRPGAYSDPGDLAPSPAGLSASRWLQDVPSPRTLEGAGPPERLDDDELERALAEDRANRERAGIRAGGGVAASASGGRAARRAATQAGPPPKVSAARRGPITAGPSWERPRRFEAYPTLKTRLGLPAIPRLGVAALALLVAAIVLFLLPFILGRGGGGGSVATPSPSAAASAASLPSEQPVASPQAYVIKSGDTLLKIAKKFNLTVDELLAANPQIKNPNKIVVGNELIIPVPAPNDGIDGASPAPESAAP